VYGSISFFFNKEQNLEKRQCPFRFLTKNDLNPFTFQFRFSDPIKETLFPP